jgi:electron transfer flavoprotein alpha/beta subunit
MNILVCIKQVPDDSVEVSMGADGKPDIAKITKVVNAFDTYALEMAARFKESLDDGSEITVLCVGEDEAKNSLKNCLAVGAEYAYLASDAAFDGSDSAGIAAVITDAIAKLEEEKGKFDLIFTGKEATDAALGQTGIFLANALGTGVITNVIAIEAQDGQAVAKQETEDGYRMVTSALPCVLTVAKPDYDPRYPTIKNKMAARKKPIGDFDAAILTDAAKVGAAGAAIAAVKVYEPPKKEAGVKIQEESDEDSAVKAVEMMIDAKVLG